MPSKMQKKIIQALGKNNENHNVIDQKLGLPMTNIQSSLTEFFNRFMEDLELVNEYFPVFERRFQKRYRAYTTLRSIARKIRGR